MVSKNGGNHEKRFGAEVPLKLCLLQNLTTFVFLFYLLFGTASRFQRYTYSNCKFI